jgi:phosphomannomutase
MVLMEYMGKAGKTLEQLVDEAYAITGPFACEREDLHIAEADKHRVMAESASGHYTKLGGLPITATENTDGYKFHVGDGEWVMVRASGTEPVLRVYSEAANSTRAFELIAAAKVMFGVGQTALVH